MAGIVNIDFRIGGEEAVLRTFKTINQAAQATAREQIRAERQTTAASSRATAQRAQNNNADWRASVAGIRRKQEALGAAMAKEIDETRKTARKRQEVLGAALAKEVEDTRKAERRKEEIRGAAMARDIRQTKRHARSREAEERRGQRMAYAMDFARIDDVNTRRGHVRSTIGDAVKRGAATGFGIVGAGAALVGGYLGTNTVLDAGRSQLDLDRRAALLQNSTGDRKTNFVGLAKGISNVTGDDAGDILGGIEQLTAKSGAEGLAQTKDYLVDLAKLAKGAGIEFGNMGEVLGTLVNRGIQGKDLVRNVEALIEQGKDGAVEFKDLATMLDASSGALIKFKMNATDRAMSAGGLSQIARTYGKSSPAEATNAVVDIARDLGGKANEIKKLSGVEVGTDSTRAQLRDVNQILPDIIEGMVKKGNAGKLEGQGGVFTGNSTTISTPLMQAFTLGLKRNESGRLQIVGDGEKADLKGRAAVVALLKQFEQALPKAGESAKSFNNTMSTQSEKLKLAMAQLKNELGDKLVPAINQGAPQFTKLVRAFGDITAWALSNPFAAIGGLIMASVVKSLLGAGASSLLDKLLSKAIPAMSVTAGTVNVLGGAGAGNVLGGAAGAAGAAGAGGAVSTAFGANSLRGIAAGGAGAIGVASAATLAAGSAGVLAGAGVAGGIESGLKRTDTFGRAMEANTLIGAIKGGRGTAADRERLKVLQGEMRAEQDKGAVSRFFEGATGGFRGGAKEALMTAKELYESNGGSAVLMAARGVGNAVLGGQQAEADTTTREALVEIGKVLAKPKADEGVIAAIQALPQAIAGAVNLQGPKVQP